MSKLKTRSSAAKRVVNITRTGKVMGRRRSNQHLTSRKSKRTLSNSGGPKVLPKQQAKNMVALLPYGI